MKNYKRNLVSFFFVALFTTILFTACPPQRTPSTGDPKSLTLITGSTDGAITYYYLDGAWYSDRACTKKVALEIETPNALNSTINVDFGGGKVDNSPVSQSLENEEDAEDMSVRERAIIKQDTVDLEVLKEKKQLSWGFKFFHKDGSAENYFGDGNELKLPANGITDNVTLVAEYDNTRYKYSLPNLVKTGLTFKGYVDNTKNDVKAGKALYITNTQGNRIYTASFVNDSVRTLTLNIEGQNTPKKLYYGVKEQAWYSEYDGKGGALQEKYKINEPDKPQFTIPSSPMWTVTLDKGTPNGAIESDFSFSENGNSVSEVKVTAELSLISSNNTSVDYLIDKATGVIKAAIDNDITINGTYPAVAIGKTVTAKSENKNYEFNEWECGDQKSSGLATIKVKGNTTVKASWKNIATFKLLRVMDNGVEIDKAYFNSKDQKWYESESTTTLKTSVKVPNVKEKTYTVEYNYDNGSSLETKQVKSAFLGYGLEGESGTKLNYANNSISLSDYEINDHATLESKWDEVKAEEKTPAKDGYKFVGWTKNGNDYDFNTPLDENIKLKAEWAPKEYNTLTLSITGKEPKYLYYGTDDNTWYKALSNNNLLLNENKVEGEVTFNIPGTETWTVTFDKNTPNGVTNASDFTLKPSSVNVESQLALTRDDLIETNGKVKVNSIVNSETITGEYQPTPIGQDITSTSNGNYELENYVAADGKTIAKDKISEYKVSGNTTIKASWKNVSNLKVLTVKDGDNPIDTAYYNTNGNIGWYKINDPNELTDENKKTTVEVPRSKAYNITLAYDDGKTQDVKETRTSSFSGYKAGDKTIGTDGSLNGLVIDSDTTLYATWNDVTYTRPTSDPTRDGYVFVKWSQDGTNEYNFDSAVTSNVTIKALWTKKTYKTLTLSIEGNEQHYYYGSDGAWYDKLENDLLLDANKKTGDNRKFTIPSKSDWTVSLSANAPEGVTGNFSLGKYTITISPKLTLSDESIINKDTGVIKVSFIPSDVVITGSYPKQKIGEKITAASGNKNYAFNVWQLEDGTTVSSDNLADVEVSANTTIKATWKNIAEFFTLIVTDGGEEQDRAYYNTADKQWYSSASISSAVKSSVKTPRDSVRNYSITLDLAGGKTADGKTGKVNYATLTSSFEGYGDKIDKEGTLNGVSITENTTLASRRATLKIEKPADPERDGFTFGGWTINGVEYDFGNPVTSSTTLTASWNRIGYSELTLNIPAKGYSETLYYGTNGSWYKALGKDNLLLIENKIGGKAKFDIPSSPVWTAKFDKNTPVGAEDSQITINNLSNDSITKTPTLTLTPSDVISTSEETYGEVISAISGNTTITGTYPAVAIGENATATSSNTNFEFKEWVVTKADGTTEVIGKDDISYYTINSDVTIKATWENKSDIKTLRVYGDNNELLDTAYYNTTDSKWYSTNDPEKLSGATITSVKLPSSLTKSHAVYLNYDRGLDEEPYNIVNLPRTFRGYATSQTENEVQIPTTGYLEGYSITGDTELYAIWSDARYVGANKDPERDGYVLKNWVLDSDETETPFDFDNNKVTSDITLRAIWLPKTYKTLTLTIPSAIGDIVEQKLYYGSDSSWYRALSDDNLLLNSNRINDIRNERLTIPASPKWTATIHVNAPSDALDKTKFYVSKSSITKTPTLSLSDESVIDKSTGRVRVTTISRDISITGSYNSVRLAESATANSGDGNYVFKGWAITQALGEGENTINLLDYEIRENVDIYAIWDNKSEFKLLTVMNGDETIDTAYYNTADKLWYSSAAVESGNRKTKVLLPEVKTKNYVVTLDYNNGNESTTRTLTSSFNGYGTRGEIRADGSLSSYSISAQATLNSSWTEVKASKPVLDPRYDGHTFDKWVLEGDESKEYDFNKAVTDNITIKALWKTNADYKTLTLKIGSDEQKLYYGSDGIWYKALGEGGLLLAANRVYSTNVKFNISSSSVSMEFENETPKGAKKDEFKLSTTRISKTSTLNITSNSHMLDKTTGVVKVSSISANTTITGEYSQIKVDENVTASTTSKNWEFDKWVKVSSDGTTTPIVGSIADQIVTEPTTFRATWKSKAAFTPLTLKNKTGEAVNTIYYNSTDDKWYSTGDITTATEIANAPLPEEKSVKYTVTFKDGDNVYSTSETTPSEFTGYYLTGAENPSINTTGTLYNYRISTETELTERWSAAKAVRPNPPTSTTKVFDKWTDENGEDYDFDSEVSEGITLIAKWSEAVTITFKDGTETKDTAYYNPKTEKWTTTLTGTDEKTSVNLPATTTKEHHVTFSLDGGTLSGDTKKTLTSNFEGYANEGGTVVIETNGLIPSTFKPAESLTLVSSWSEVKADKPADPTKDGYNFKHWYIENEDKEVAYNFSTAVTGDITLVAAWTQKEHYTLTIDGIAYYYEQGSENEWYRALGEGDLLLIDNKMRPEEKKLKKLDAKKATVTVEYGDGAKIIKQTDDDRTYFANGTYTREWMFTGYYDANNEFSIPASDSMTLPDSISGKTVLTAKYDSSPEIKSLPLLAKDGYTQGDYEVKITKNGEETPTTSSVYFSVLPNIYEIKRDTTYVITAQWTKKTANTLTLSIPGSTVDGLKTQTLYYGSDGAWYSKTEMKPGEGELLLDANKLRDDAVEFSIPTAPTWTITVEKNTPNGATDEQITVPTIAAKTPTLSLDNKIVDATGKVTGTISAATTVNGTYDPVAIGTFVAPSSNNPNYTFKNWKVNDGTTETEKTNDELATYEVSGDVTITAQWESKADFITVTFKNDGTGVSEEEIGVKYYNRTDKKWYNSKTLTDSTTTIDKPNSIPTDYYEVYLVDDDEATSLGSTTIASGTFNGYFAEGMAITSEEDGKLNLNEFTTTKASVVAKARWTDVKVKKPNDPKDKEGYTFTGWKKQGEEGSFVFDDATIKGETILVAMWEKIKTYSLKIWDSYDHYNANNDPSVIYYWSIANGGWFKDTSCADPVSSDAKLEKYYNNTVTVSVNFDGGTTRDTAIYYFKNGVTTYYEFMCFNSNGGQFMIKPDNEGNVKLPSEGINGDKEIYPRTSAYRSLDFPSLKKSGYTLLGFRIDSENTLRQPTGCINYDYYSTPTTKTVTAIWGLTLTVQYNADDTATYYYGSDGYWYQDVKDSSSGAVTGKAVITNTALTNALSSRDITVTLVYAGGDKPSDGWENTTANAHIYFWKNTEDAEDIRQVSDLVDKGITDNITVSPYDIAEEDNIYAVVYSRPVPTKSGYTFIGWKGPDGKDFEDDPVTSFYRVCLSDGSSQTFTAVWEPEASTPTLPTTVTDDNGNTRDTVFLDGTGTTKLTNPTYKKGDAVTVGFYRSKNQYVIESFDYIVKKTSDNTVVSSGTAKTANYNYIYFSFTMGDSPVSIEISNVKTTHGMM